MKALCSCDPERVKAFPLLCGDTTVTWFLPEGGAYVFPGDDRERKGCVVTTEDVEDFFRPSFTVANRKDIEALAPGDGPCAFVGTREELYAVLGFTKAAA